MRKSIFDLQVDVLLKCMENGKFKIQPKRHSRINEAIRLAVKSGLMKHVDDYFLVLTVGGKEKANKLKELGHEI